MPPIDTRIWEVEETDESLKIKLYRKFEYGLRDSIGVLLLLLVGLLITACILFFSFKFPQVFISFGLIIIMMVLLVILAFKLISYSEVQEIEITQDAIRIQKKSRIKNEVKQIPRNLVTHLKMPGADYSVEGMFVDYVAFPLGFFFPKAIGDDLSPAFYIGNASVHFFEFGTKSQKMWIMKYIHRYLFG